jgi:hypothetical protein
MTKHEFPPFNMVIENGRLVPATPYDQERLLSFTRGTKVKVRFTEEKDRVLVRKWWAILGLVVKQCRTPWTTKEEASEAVKLALGIVNLTKTVQNNYLQYPKSLTELEDPELQEAVDNMTELLSRLTGVDVETLKKETAHIKPEPDEPHDPETGELTEQPTSDAPSPASDDDSAAPSPSEPVKEPADDPAPFVGSPIQERELVILRRFAKDTLSLAANPKTTGDTMSKAVRRWFNMELANLSDEGMEIAKGIKRSVESLMRDEVDYRVTVEFHAEGLSCEPADLMPEVSTDA